jgi:hypothetical protein
MTTNQKMSSLGIRRADPGDTDVQQQAARDLARKHVAAIARGEDVGPMRGPLAATADGSITLNEAVDLYEQGGFHGRRETYRKQSCSSIRRISKFLQNKTVVDLTPSDVRAYRIAKGNSTAAIEFDFKALRAMLNWLAEDRLTTVTRPRLRSKIVSRYNKRRPAMTTDRHEKLLKAAASCPASTARVLLC